MDYILQNPLILVSLVLLVMVGLAYIIVKPRKKQAKKIDKKPESESKSEQTEEKPVDENVIVSETEDKSKKKKKKLRRLKPEITHVYEKKKLKTKEEKTEDSQEEKSAIEEEFLKRMQFVKSSKNISKLKPYTPKEEVVEEEHIEELSMPEEECVFCEEKHKSSYFDRSRRLSKMIKDGTFDDMFCSHISEKYMNIDDISRHIRNCDEIEQKLYERAAKTMANSEAKLAISEDGKVQKRSNKDDIMAAAEERKREALASYVTSNNEEYQQDDYDYEDLIQSDVDLSARNILVVDSILNRKGKSKSKK